MKHECFPERKEPEKSAVNQDTVEMAQLTEKQAPWTPLLLEFKRQKTRVAHAVYMEQHIRNILAYRATETLQEVAHIQ